jgi:hypothetical protein
MTDDVREAVDSLLKWRADPNNYPFVVGAVIPVLDAYLAGLRKKKRKTPGREYDLENIASGIFSEARRLGMQQDVGNPLVRTAGMLRFYATRLEEIADAAPLTENLISSPPVGISE